MINVQEEVVPRSLVNLIVSVGLLTQPDEKPDENPIIDVHDAKLVVMQLVYPVTSMYPPDVYMTDVVRSKVIQNNASTTYEEKENEFMVKVPGFEIVKVTPELISSIMF